MAAFGLRDPTLVGKPEARNLGVSECAQLLAAAITSKRPHGPYVLAVHGSAGVPACWECAHALVAQGLQVARIVILDGCRPLWRFGQDAAKFEKLLKKKVSAGVSATRPSPGKFLGDDAAPGASSPDTHKAHLIFIYMYIYICICIYMYVYIYSVCSVSVLFLKTTFHNGFVY